MTDLVSFFGNKLGNILHKFSREMYINFQILVIDLGKKSSEHCFIVFFHYNNKSK